MKARKLASPFIATLVFIGQAHWGPELARADGFFNGLVPSALVPYSQPFEEIPGAAPPIPSPSDIAPPVAPTAEVGTIPAAVQASAAEAPPPLSAAPSATPPSPTEASMTSIPAAPPASAEPASAPVLNGPVAEDPVSSQMIAPCDYDACPIEKDILSCCNMCPCAYGYVEGLIFSRNNRSENRTLVRDINTGNSLLQGRSSDFNYDGGLRAVFGKRYCDEYALEFGYLGIFDQQSSATVTGNNNLIVDGTLGQVVNNFGLADEITMRYASRVHSMEANLICCGCCCDTSTTCSESAWLLGYRFLSLDERFHLVSTDFQESTTDYAVQTRNYLHGVQVGHRHRRCLGRWSWEAIGKAGVFGNGAQQTSDALIDFPNFLFRPATSAKNNDAAFVGELNLTSIYHLNRTWGIRTGYNLLWVEGVALAPDQLDFTNLATSGFDINHSGELLLYGTSIGLEARW